MESFISFKQLERLYSNDSSRLKFITALHHFLVSKRETIPQTILTEIPVINNRPLDLYDLFHQVDRREGYDKVTMLNKWQEITEAMKLQNSQISLKDYYLKYLRYFEEAIRKKTQQQLQQQQILQQQQQHHQQQQQQQLQQQNPQHLHHPHPQHQHQHQQYSHQLHHSQQSQLQQQQQHQQHHHQPQPFPIVQPLNRQTIRPLDSNDPALLPPQKRPRPGESTLPNIQSQTINPNMYRHPSQLPPQLPRSNSLTQIHNLPNSNVMNGNTGSGSVTGSGNIGNNNGTIGANSNVPNVNNSGTVGGTVSIPQSGLNTQTTATTGAGTTASSSIIVSTSHINAAIKSLLSSDQNIIKQGLNYLMQLSLEGDNSRNILFVEKYPAIMTALGSLLDVVNPFTKILFTLTSNDVISSSFDITQYFLHPASYLEQSTLFWNETNPLDKDNVLQSMARNLDTNSLLIATLCIIRNLSFEMANVQMIAYSAVIMQHLIALLLIASSPTSISPPVSVPYVYRSRNPALTQATSYALDTLYHIAKYIDITGLSRVGNIAEDCWQRDTFHHQGNEREMLKVYLSDHFSTLSTGKYIAATSFLFPSLLRCITQSYERDITRRCLGIFTKLTSNANNTFIFSRKCPDSNLELLIQLLCTNVTLTEPIRIYYPPSSDVNQSEAQSQLTNGLSPYLFDRLPACSSDFNEFNDLEIRDMVLDALRSLCSHPDVNIVPSTITTASSSINSSISTNNSNNNSNNNNTMISTNLNNNNNNSNNNNNNNILSNNSNNLLDSFGFGIGSNIQIIPSLKERIASQPLCLQLLISILMSSSGKLAKSEGFHRALSLLSLLSMHPKNHSKFLIIQKKICLLTMSDDTIAEAVMTSSLRNILQNNFSYVGEILGQED